MSKQKDKCEMCKDKKNKPLFLIELEVDGCYLYCYKCLATRIQEKPDTIIKVWRLDNKYYEIIQKEVEKQNGN